VATIIESAVAAGMDDRARPGSEGLDLLNRRDESGVSMTAAT
jgi:hypothetical protein